MAKSISIPITGNAAPLRKVLDRTEKRFSSFAGGVTKAFAGLAGVGAGLAGGLTALGQHFDNLENTIIRGTGASGEALDDLVDSAQNVLRQVPDSGDLVASTLADVNTFFGQTGSELETTTEAFLDFARVAEVDTNKAIGAVDAALVQFGEDASEVDEVLGDFTRIAQATGAPMDQLLGQMETFGPLFANAGFELEETTAILGQLEQAGVSVTRVGPALNRFFRNAAENGEDPREALEAIVEELQNTESSTEALSKATAAFGAEGAQRMLSAIRSNNFELEEFNGLLGEGTGVVDAQADAVLTLTDKFNMLKNRVLVALAPVAERVFDAVMVAIDAVLPVVERLMAAFDEDGVGGVFSELSDLAKEVWPQIKEALGDFLAAFGSWIVDDALPFMLEKAQELGAALVDWIGPRIVPALKALGEFVAAAAQWLIDDGLPLLVEKLQEWGGAFVDWIKPQIVPALKALGEMLIAIGDWLITEALPKIAALALDLGKSLVAGFLDLAPEVIKGLVTMIFDVGSWIITEGIPKLLGYGADLGMSILDGLTDGLSSALSGLGGVAKSVVNSIIGLINSAVIDGINDLLEFKIPGPFGTSVTINPPDIPHIPQLADGGIVTSPTLALIGEAGPEAVVPLNQMGSMGNGGNNYQINVQTGVGDPGAIGQSVVEAITAYERRNGAGWRAA